MGSGSATEYKNFLSNCRSFCNSGVMVGAGKATGAFELADVGTPTLQLHFLRSAAIICLVESSVSTRNTRMFIVGSSSFSHHIVLTEESHSLPSFFSTFALSFVSTSSLLIPTSPIPL
ncbi:hypothetical protein C1H46_012564 [Malus baccata]|uniref:Uncharacterized protein n=1 Tax=Malus baccata TaxID=106549 RepID=A0A540MSJ6_MALBA|nr:hypothetical protein C1H46_012564 [Malus baccata]